MDSHIRNKKIKINDLNIIHERFSFINLINLILRLKIAIKIKVSQETF